MSTITLNVIHTIDPAAIEALRGLLHPAAATISPAVTIQQPPAASAPLAPPAPVQTAPPIQAPPAQIMPATAPQPQTMPPTTVPTTDRTYTVDELARAGAALMDAGKGAEALAAMQQFGVQRITDLVPEQYAAFAAALRNLGAKI